MESSLRIETITRMGLDYSLDIFNYLYTSECDAVIITKQGVPRCVVLPYNELVIDSDSKLLLPEVSITVWKNKKSQFIYKNSEGFFLRTVKYGSKYLSMVPPDWFFEEQHSFM